MTNLQPQGGHYLYNLSTHEYITRQYVTLIPMTTTVIEAVECLAKADGMTNFVLQDKEGIKFLTPQVSQEWITTRLMLTNITINSEI